jgi:Protein of unknown function (DUF2950)
MRQATLRSTVARNDEGEVRGVPGLDYRRLIPFDVRAGVEEMRIRRIGRSELAAIKSRYACFDAQREYGGQRAAM